MTLEERYADTVTLPRAVRFPVELVPPPGFDPERLETFPDVPGRLEYVEGRLLFMPPCSDVQQDVVADVVVTLGAWVRGHPEFVLGTNEAGMRLGGATRAADAAIWSRRQLGGYTGQLRKVPPLLAVEVAGEDDTEAALREKARWYLSVGSDTVWIALPAERAVRVITSSADERFVSGDRLPEPHGLPGLTPEVVELFVQLARG